MKTPTKEHMLEMIYREIADKTLSFWCLVKEEPDEYAKQGLTTLWSYWCTRRYCCKSRNEKHVVDKVIWHPVLIGDCLKWCKANIDNYGCILDYACNYDDIVSIRKDLSWPIDKEPDAIEFMYDLIVNNNYERNL